MTSSNGLIFRVTGPLCRVFTSHRWIPLTKASAMELWCFLWSVPKQTVEQTILRLVMWDAIMLIMMSLEWVDIFIKDLEGPCRDIMNPVSPLKTMGMHHHSHKTYWFWLLQSIHTTSKSHLEKTCKKLRNSNVTWSAIYVSIFAQFMHLTPW